MMPFLKPKVSKISFPEGKIGFAVGDVHGRADLLERMLDALVVQAREHPDKEPVAIFLGDYVDRGLESARVIDLLLTNRLDGFDVHFLRGNHEQAMQQFMLSPREGRGWLSYGGAETLLSYGVKPIGPDASPEAMTEAATSLRQAMPKAHTDFFSRLLPYTVLGDYFFAHAGVDTARDVHEQDEHDLYWIRERFLNGRKPWKKLVVHGHTPVPEPYADSRRICVDTGAYATGRLTCVRLEENRVAFLSV